MVRQLRRPRSKTKTRFVAYQAMVGFAVGLSEQWDLDIGYRYFVAPDASFEGVDDTPGSTSCWPRPAMTPIMSIKL
jgi:opacity protein-like surface antigen